ncbi:MAG TPA: glycosyltransferase [Acidimicrobiia bacterium]|nr:glycosyltransferase [Acidimicrobiia bacterium]
MHRLSPFRRSGGTRVALVSEHASPLAALGGVDAGGQNVHVACLARHLARSGFEVDVYTRRDSPDLRSRVPFGPRVNVVHVDAGPPQKVPKDDLLPHMEEFAAYLSGAFDMNLPDVVHSHFWMSGLAALDAVAGRDIPLAHTFHALGVVKRREQGRKDTSPPERLDVERRILCEADRIVATCSDEAFELMRLGLSSDRVNVVPCGVDLTQFGPEGPAEERTPGMRRVGVLTRLVERKGVGNVIEAMAAVPNAELVVVGGPEPGDLPNDPEARRLRDVAERAGVAERVTLRGRIPRTDVPVFLRSCDVVVCAPWYEPFGIVPLEAMACGVPVVASAVGGMLDTVVDGVTGIHVPPRSPDRLAEALSELLPNAATLAAMGEAGARRATSFSWERVAASTAEIYADLVDRRPAATADWPVMEVRQ